MVTGQPRGTFGLVWFLVAMLSHTASLCPLKDWGQHATTIESVQQVPLETELWIMVDSGPLYGVSMAAEDFITFIGPPTTRSPTPWLYRSSALNFPKVTNEIH